MDHSGRHSLAVVIPTVGRNSLVRAARSVFQQKISLKIHLLIGVDVDLGRQVNTLRDQIEREKPSNFTLTWLDVGYSTSRRHGGQHACNFGGAIRSVLTFLADARYVMYLDDDDWLHEEHAKDILKAIQDVSWAHSLCFYANSDTCEILEVDELESVGVYKGIYANKFGGFVRPSGLTIDKLKLLHLTHLWSCSAFPTGDGEDRLMFSALMSQPHRSTNRATVFHSLDPRDSMHTERLRFLASKGRTSVTVTKNETVRSEI